MATAAWNAVAAGTRAEDFVQSQVDLYPKRVAADIRWEAAALYQKYLKNS